MRSLLAGAGIVATFVACSSPEEVRPPAGSQHAAVLVPDAVPDAAFLPPDLAFVEPDLAFVEPDFAFVEPDLAFVEPDLAFVEPDFALVEPDLALVEPDLAFVEPDLAFVEPDLAFVEPDLAFVEPDLAFVEPDLAVPDAGTTCSDCAKNGDETDVDCGGSCKACQDGQACVVAADCLSGVCIAGACARATCSDHVKNAAESDVDCGGGGDQRSPCERCVAGQACGDGTDCESSVCAGGVCQAATCADGIKNGTETYTDCGGSCTACSDGGICRAPMDCASGFCDGTVCRPATCSDLVRNGTETAVDCGGVDGCAACGDGVTCAVDRDCASEICQGGACGPRASVCHNGVKDSPWETDVDCGGPCLPCDSGACNSNADCTTRRCVSGACRPASCDDGVLDGSETDLDCGGVCGPCRAGQHCSNSVDCLGSSCSSGVCAPTCHDFDKSGSETDVDCGGYSCQPCQDQEACAVPNDCLSGVCLPHAFWWACGALVCAAPADPCPAMEKYATDKYKDRKKGPTQVVLDVMTANTKVLFLGERHTSAIHENYPEIITALKKAHANLDCLFLEWTDQASATKYQEGKMTDAEVKKALGGLNQDDAMVKALKVARDSKMLLFAVDADKDRDAAMAAGIKAAFDDKKCTRGLMIVGAFHLDLAQSSPDDLRVQERVAKAMKWDAADLPTVNQTLNLFATNRSFGEWNSPHSGADSSCKWSIDVDNETWGFVTPAPGENQVYDRKNKRWHRWDHFSGYLHVKGGL